uniref:ATP synthase F1 subunit delta n=1 Tax=Candidatus Scatousia sp. TaxID=3085663 RepID=UPI00402836B9
MGKHIQQISISAKNYANALIGVIEDKKVTFEQITNDFDTVCKILEMSKELQCIMYNPTIAFDMKIDIAVDVFKDDISNTMMDFIKILIEKKRFNEFSQIYKAYTNRLNEINNIQPVTIVSAVELTDSDKAQVIQKLENKLNKTVKADWELNEDIIAGLVIKINDNVIDMSIKHKLAGLKKDLMLR